MLYMSSSGSGVLPVLEIVTWVSRPRLSPVFLWQLVSSICQFQILYKGPSGRVSGPFSRLNLIWRVDGSPSDWSGPSPHYFLLSLCQRTLRNCPVEICLQICLWVSRTHKCCIQSFIRAASWRQQQFKSQQFLEFTGGRDWLLIPVKIQIVAKVPALRWLITSYSNSLHKKDRWNYIFLTACSKHLDPENE